MKTTSDAKKDDKHIRKARAFFEKLKSHIESHIEDIKENNVPFENKNDDVNKLPFFWSRSGELVIPANNIDSEYDELWIQFKSKGHDGLGYSKKNNKKVMVIKALKAPFDATYLNTRISAAPIIHEYTHYIDDMRQAGKATKSAELFDKGDVADYFNDPSEYNAYYQEALSTIQSALEHMEEAILKRYNTKAKFLEFFMTIIDTEFKKFLNEKYKRKLLKRISSFYDEFIDKKSLASLKDWSGTWVHYTDINKLGVNPKQFHQDIAGIYLFPEEFKTSGTLWKEKKFKFTVKLKSTANVLDLSQLSEQDMWDILEKLNISKDYVSSYSLEKKGRLEIDPFWEALKNYYILVTNAKGPAFWNKEFRRMGYDAIFDDTGSIHTSEVQLVVLQPSVLEIIEVDSQDMKRGQYTRIKNHMELLAKELKPFGEVEVRPLKKQKKSWYEEEGLKGVVKLILPNDEYINWAIIDDVRNQKMWIQMVDSNNSHLYKLRQGMSVSANVSYGDEKAIKKFVLYVLEKASGITAALIEAKLAYSTLSWEAWLKEEGIEDYSDLASYYDKSDDDLIGEYGHLVDKDDYIEEDMSEEEVEEGELKYIEALEQELWKEAKDKFEDWFEKYKKLSDPLIVYRAVELPNIDALDKDQLGVYWSDNESNAFPYVSGGKKSGMNMFTLKASIPKSAIDWDFTVSNNMNLNLGEDEQEINILPNTKIEVLDINECKGDGKDHWLGLSFEGNIGGIGSGDSKLKANAKKTEYQLGLDVEKEHKATIQQLIKDVENNNIQPFEHYFGMIAKDHLAELKDYYTLLTGMEKKAKAELRDETGEFDTDVLLSWSGAYDEEDLDDAIDHINLMRNRYMEDGLGDIDITSRKQVEPETIFPVKCKEKKGWLKDIDRDQWVSEIKKKYDREFNADLDDLNDVIVIDGDLGDGYGRALLAYGLGEKVWVSFFDSTDTSESSLKVEADIESKILFHSDYSQISLDFIESKYHSYQPNQILFEPIKYYTVDTRFDDYEDKILTIKAYTEKDILVNTIELDDPQQVANFQDIAEDIIDDNEKEIYEEASDLYDSIYRDWEEYKLRDIIDVLNDILKAKLPEDIKKTKYKDYLIKNSSISESLYIHLIESPPEPDEFDDDEHKQWHDNDDWDLKVRISSHEIPNSSSIYGKTDVNIKISATSKPEEIYSKFIQYISKIEDTPKYTDHITASTFIQQLNLKFADIMRSKDFQKIVIREAEEYRNEQTDEEMLERAFDELYPKWMQDLERRGTFIGNGLEVYRGISVKEESDIDYDKLGVYWTWDKEKADNYSDANTSIPITILTALVSINDIDLEATLSKVVWAGYDFEESEREITLKPNTKLKILAPVEKEATASIVTASINTLLDNFRKTSNYKKYMEEVRERSSKVPEWGEDSYNEAVNDFCKDFKEDAQVIDGRLKIWRIVYLDNISKLETKSIGCCWTWKEKSVKKLANSLESGVPKNEQYVVVGYVPLSAIDYPYTLMMNLWLPEDELTLKKNTKVLITEVYNLADKKKSLVTFDPPKEATASVTAGISNIVYHFTMIHSAVDILKENQFKLTFISGADDNNTPKNKYYYLSTTRSPASSYHKGSYIGVLLKLNGRKLQDNYVGNPVDYWGPSFRKVQPDKNEMEDRIWSDKPFIKPATKYIEEIHIFYDTKYSEDPKNLRDLLIQAKRNNIPYYVYKDQKSALLLDKRKAVSLDELDLKVEPKKLYHRTPMDWLASWVELYEKDNKKYLSKRAKRNIDSLWAFDGFTSFSNDIHNQKKGTAGLHKLVEILKKEKWTVKQFYEQLQEKWTK